MKFKEFKKWCNNRAADGCWSFNIAMVCIRIVEEVHQQPFWKREKFWKEKYEKDVVEQIVEPLIISGLSLLIGWAITDKTDPNLEECMAAGWVINTIVLSIIVTVIFFSI